VSHAQFVILVLGLAVRMDPSSVSEERSENYSQRNACVGSVFAARRAGI
jgi:hypothetical protein